MNVWQGFGKRKNMVGMAKPKKTKVDVVETALAVVSNKESTATAKKEKPSTVGTSSAARKRVQVWSSEERAWWKATDELVKASAKATEAEAEASKLKEQAKLAQRLFDAKQRRWGEPKNRRGIRKLRRPVTEVCRIYEAIISLQTAQIQCVRAEYRAAVLRTVVRSCLSKVDRLQC